MAAEGNHVWDTDDFFEMSIDCLCVAGLDGFFKRVNGAWMRTLGWTEAELLSRPSLEFVHPDDRASTLAGRQTLQQGAAMGPLVNRYLCKDGSFRWFEWRSIAHVDLGLVYATARDVTEQKLSEHRLVEAAKREELLERQLVVADRMASVGTLAGGVAHEINNPLASVTANIALMIEELALAPRARPEFLEMAVDIQDAATRIGSIVRGLQTFSDAREERRTLVELRPILEQAEKLTSHTLRNRGRLVTSFGRTPLVYADEARLGQVFVNVLINAAQALDESGGEANEVRVVTTTDAEGRAVIEIRDTGIGIPAPLLARIFDPFFTTKAVGVGPGLGLSICHTIVRGMGGEISAESEPGRGTTIRVVLPAAAPVRTPATEKLSAAILVVDDELAVGTALGRILRAHEVTVVTDAEAALRLLEEGKAFDVILSDLMMPGMSGMEFYDQLALRFPAAAGRVVFISGGAPSLRASAFLERVPNMRIDKPFAPDVVRALVQRQLADVVG